MIVSFGGLFVFRWLLKKQSEKKEVASWENTSKCASLTPKGTMSILLGVYLNPFY